MVRVGCLGFGWAGVLAAWFLVKRYPQAEIIAIDASQKLGGLMRSEVINGFTFDIGGTHVIFSRNRTILKEIISLLKRNYIKHERRAFVLFENEYYVPYPFENGIYVLPPEVRAELIADFITAQLELTRNPDWHPRNFEEWIVKTFGKSIAEKYLIPYNEKIWKRQLNQISADWVFIPGRLPRPDVRNLIRSVAGIPTIGYVENAYFYYPARGGIQALYNSVLNRVKRESRYIKIIIGERIEKIKRIGNEYIINDRYRVDKIISTIPILELVKAIDAPEDVIKAASRLDYNQVVVVGLALSEPAPSQHWVYVPEKDVVFHRYAWISNYSPNNAPQDKSAIIAEITVPKERHVDLERIVEEAIEGFERLGIFSKVNISFVKVWHHTYGYPVHGLDHVKTRQIVINWLERHGVKTIGRWGQWRYWNMDKVYENVLETVNNMAREL